MKKGQSQARNYTTKDYRDNEDKVMRRLGLEPVPGSGCGWRHKGDGESEHVLCELKSSERDTIPLKWFDLRKIEAQAKVAHKIPILVINDLTRDEEYVIVKPQFLKAIAELLEYGTAEELDTVQWTGVEEGDTEAETATERVVRSDPRARERALRQQEQAWNSRNRKRGFFD